MLEMQQLVKDQAKKYILHQRQKLEMCFV